ncbi:MAG: hypothetical protein A2309_04950 [Bacteroidetes bacterium RIFOXYB2_FULL_35_7]|nr:MAG: hypothetical protein A2309_04950 [Bacteroidetes bacterium RIFOXYB2_FULL_35_7]
MIETHRYLGLKFSVFSINELKQDIINNIHTRAQKIYFGYSLTQLPWIKTKPELFSLSDQFDVFVPDGKGLYMYLKFLGFKIGDHINLPDLADLMLRIADENQFKVFLLGATEDVNTTAVENLSKMYPNALIPVGINGYYEKEDEIEIVKKINLENPDILIIGISSPKKEQFASKWRESLNVPVIIPCGGMIDVYAGKTKREPRWIQNIGMAWIYRFIQEPKRLSVLLKNGFSVLLGFMPYAWFQIKILKNKNYSIQNYYKIYS